MASINRLIYIAANLRHRQRNQKKKLLCSIDWVRGKNYTQLITFFDSIWMVHQANLEMNIRLDKDWKCVDLKSWTHHNNRQVFLFHLRWQFCVSKLSYRPQKYWTGPQTKRCIFSLNCEKTRNMIEFRNIKHMPNVACVRKLLTCVTFA